MSEFDPNLQQNDPTAGENAGAGAGTQPGPAERTFTQAEVDSQMANARRAFEYESQRQYERRLAEERQTWERSQQPQPKSDDPWSKFDPSVSESLRAAIKAELEQHVNPLIQNQEDVRLANDEVRMGSQYPDYRENRLAILEFAVQRQIPDLDVAYHAWRSQNKWQNPDEIGRAAVAAYTKRKTSQASSTPSVEGRGGAAPNTKQKITDWDKADEAAAEIFRASQD